MNQENINKKLFNKNNPFKTPDGYFNDFNSKLFQRIENESHIVKVKFWHSWKNKVAIAASFAILAVFSFTAYQFINKQNFKNQNSIIVITDNDSDTELSFIDENHLIEAITTTENEQKVEGDDIINYLVDGDIDENAIAEAY